jgi:hypothetical protein
VQSRCGPCGLCGPPCAQTQLGPAMQSTVSTASVIVYPCLYDDIVPLVNQHHKKCVHTENKHAGWC